MLIERNELVDQRRSLSRQCDEKSARAERLPYLKSDVRIARRVGREDDPRAVGAAFLRREVANAAPSKSPRGCASAGEPFYKKPFEMRSPRPSGESFFMRAIQPEESKRAGRRSC